MREKIKLESTAGTGHFYTTTKNKNTTTEKLSFKKFDPVVRKHVIYKEMKLKEHQLHTIKKARQMQIGGLFCGRCALPTAVWLRLLGTTNHQTGERDLRPEFAPKPRAATAPIALKPSPEETESRDRPALLRHSIDEPFACDDGFAAACRRWGSQLARQSRVGHAWR